MFHFVDSLWFQTTLQTEVEIYLSHLSSFPSTQVQTYKSTEIIVNFHVSLRTAVGLYYKNLLKETESLTCRTKFNIGIWSQKQ